MENSEHNKSTTETAEQPQTLDYELQTTLSGKVNLADFQNAVPVIKELGLLNNTGTDLRGVRIRLSAEPGFLKPRTWLLDTVAAGSKYSLRDLDVQLDAALLGRLTEAETATLTFTAFCENAPEQVLAQTVQTVELLPRNQWAGLSHLPDMVAAFVQPNDPAIDHLLKQVAETLRKHDKNTALNGYEDGAKRAWELASAVWSTVAGLGIDYAYPPASFERQGQKVRSPSQIVDARIGTCFDLALLFAATLEQIGLHPLIVFTKGHAFAGFWLKAEEFSTVVVDEITALRNRVRLQELVFFETTLVTHRPSPSFSFAVSHGSSQIAEGKDDTFELAVDIRRARMQRIRPLASAESSQPTPQPGVETIPLEPGFDEAPNLPDEDIGEPASETLSPTDRLMRWQRKLLDLSLRNNLLNFRPGKKTLSLDVPDAGALEDLLAQGQTIKLLCKPVLMEGSDPRSQAIHEGRNREDVRREHALDALKRKEVFVSVDDKELEARLVDLYRNARTTMQEGGANTLYLALGFLNWTKDKDGQKHRAPLILLPVTLNRKSVRSGFTLAMHDDEPKFNPTLIEMLRQDFRLNLGVTEGELARDDAGLDISAIWKTASKAIRDIPGWEVSEEVVLSAFSFAKYLMWKDLAERTDQLRENAVVRHLIDTPRDAFASHVSFPNPKRLDAEYTPQQTFCPLPADSSQLSAVMAAARGKDFVLIGPPGTGKSQTIANLIAQCLAENKRVLFVSEKIAALDVVYRRLREVGLGEFCLELHSSKARKADVLRQLQTSWEAKGDIDQGEWRAQADTLQRYRDELNAYVQRLHHAYPNGLTIYKAIGVVVDGTAVPMVTLAWHSHDTHTKAELEAMREVVERLNVNARAVGTQQLQNGPLSGIEANQWTPSWQQSLVESTRSVMAVANRIRQTADQFLSITRLPDSKLDRRARAALASLARTLPAAHGRDWGFVLRTDARVLVDRMKEGLKLVEQHRAINAQMSSTWRVDTVSQCLQGMRLLEKYWQHHAQLGETWPADVIDDLGKGLVLLTHIAEATAQLSVPYSDAVDALNVHHLAREWSKAEKSIWPLSWWAKRGITKVIEPTVTGERSPDVASDLRLHIKIRDWRSQVSKLTIDSLTENVWAGLTTRTEFAQTALNFQQMLDAARKHQTWTDEGWEAVASGRCGKRLANDLEHMRAMQALANELKELDSLAADTSGLWAGTATQLDLLQAALRFQAARTKVPDCGTLEGEHQAVAEGECGSLLSADHAYLQQRALLEKELSRYSDLEASTTGVWQGLRTQEQDVAHVEKFHASLCAAVANLAAESERVNTWHAALERLLGADNRLLSADGPVVRHGDEYTKVWMTLRPVMDKLMTIGAFNTVASTEFSEVPIAELTSKCQQILDSENRLNAWCAWRKIRDEAVSLGLSALVSAAESESIAPSDLRQAFEVNHCRWWLNAAVDSEPVIRAFVSAEHEKRIGDFRALDKRFIELTRDWVRASLCAGLPAKEDVTRNSEWGILRHEMNKKRQHMPLRELIRSTPEVLGKLSPCLLMSPLSIAQFLSAESRQFDVVVFDEASQIAVWDAIGAIARGKQVVMVGDPKQLPPTNFFDRAESGQDDEDVEADLESILDECMGANLPTMNLAWHYRSRNESLIAFSNHRYYGGGLVTFPSPVTDDQAVSFHHVAGVYAKGGTRTNQIEAKALVADVVGRLSSPAFRESGLTIGIVTFNTEQMSLIEDLLDEERRKDPALESYFAETNLEPLFVKNLESVQGDERDIMYFSITYGPDLAGTVSMNFGPMNREGGERRLNVAITRARHELRVFSSLKAEQFDLARTQAKGVQDLKHFLEFAERGKRALAEATRGSQGDFESPFEAAVASALATKGWEVQTQIGASSFRIDLAVVHPDARGIYLAGVECDGATYHRSATARDRDMLREQVLRGLGWDILRVWSTDWWIDRAGTLDRLHAHLETLLAASRDVRKRQQEEADAARATLDAEANKQEVPLPTPTPTPFTLQVQPPLVPPQTREELPTQPELFRGNAASTQTSVSVAEFIEADPASVSPYINPAAFHDASYEPTLRAMIAHVLQVEGPVLDEVLARRIARAHGWSRTGALIQRRVLSIAIQMGKTTTEEIGTFFWPPTLDPQRLLPFRHPKDGVPRNVHEMCHQELASVAYQVIENGMSGDNAVLAMAQAMGMRQVRASSKERLAQVIQACSSAQSKV